MLLRDEALDEKVMVFKDREDAGLKLAKFLLEKGVKSDIVAAIPNGGVPVGFQVAKALGARFVAAVVKKVLYPWTTEAGFGAVSWNGEIAVDEQAARWARLTKEEVEIAVQKALGEVEKRAEIFRDYLPRDVSERSVIVIDDGLATGYTMLVAVRALKKIGASEVIVASPTASNTAIHLLQAEASLIVVLNLRTSFIFAVADAYQHWRDLETEEALEYFKRFYSQSQ